MDAQSDVNDTIVIVKVVCPKCGKSEMAELAVESLANMTRNADGSYTDEVGCADCER
jgi:sarcosine oxidase delta subunit